MNDTFGHDKQIMGDDLTVTNQSILKEAVKTKTISVDIMDLDTAIANLELLGHSFYIYRDDEEEKVAVVYKRINGGYGLIEIEN